MSDGFKLIAESIVTASNAQIAAVQGLRNNIRDLEYFCRNAHHDFLMVAENGPEARRERPFEHARAEPSPVRAPAPPAVQQVHPPIQQEPARAPPAPQQQVPQPSAPASADQQAFDRNAPRRASVSRSSSSGPSGSGPPRYTACPWCRLTTCQSPVNCSLEIPFFQRMDYVRRTNICPQRRCFKRHARTCRNPPIKCEWCDEWHHKAFCPEYAKRRDMYY